MMAGCVVRGVFTLIFGTPRDDSSRMVGGSDLSYLLYIQLSEVFVLHC